MSDPSVLKRRDQKQSITSHCLASVSFRLWIQKSTLYMRPVETCDAWTSTLQTRNKSPQSKHFQGLFTHYWCLRWTRPHRVSIFVCPSLSDVSSSRLYLLCICDMFPSLNSSSFFFFWPCAAANCFPLLQKKSACVNCKKKSVNLSHLISFVDHFKSFLPPRCLADDCLLTLH